MRFLLLLCFLTIGSFSTCYATDLIVGTSYNTHLKWQKKVEYMAFPFKKRIKEVFYSDPGQQIIKGIIARESDHTDASAIVTAGGVGFSYMNIRLKSERGSSLNYQIEIYT